MANVIGGEYKIPLIGIETKESNNSIFFASGRGAFAAILRKIIVDKNAMHEWGG